MAHQPLRSGAKSNGDIVIDLGTWFAGAKAGIGAAQLAYQGWGWFTRWRYGSVSISHPKNRENVTTELVSFEGDHDNPKKGRFWLFTFRDNNYWQKTRITLHPDGRWKESINVGKTLGARMDFVLLVWVSDFTDALLTDIKERSVKAGNWSPIKMNPDPSQFSVVQAIVLQIDIKATP